MTAEFLLELLLSGKFDNLTVREFADIAKKIEEEYELPVIDVDDDEYNKASSNAGELI